MLEAAWQSKELGLEYRDTLPPWATYKLNKSTQVAHLKMTDRHEMERSELVHADIIGPIGPKSINGFQHVCKFSCQVSKSRADYFSRTNGEALDKLIEFNWDHATPHGIKIHRLRSDNRSEHTANHDRSHCKDIRMLQEFTAPYTS